MRIRGKVLVVGVISTLLALLVMGAVLAAGVTLPTSAADKASEATAEVTVPDASAGQAPETAGQPEGTPSPNEHAAFGQCVAANAKTAADNAGSDWNPTDGCENTNRSAQSNGAAANGAEVAAENASSNAASGLETASDAKANGESHRSGH
jgi:hypothetical protein